MNATIEPHLIHLLNESTTPELSSIDLPPLTSLDFSRPPQPPIESDPTASARHGGNNGLSLINSAAPVHLTGDDGSFGSIQDDAPRKSAWRAHPLHMLLSEADDTDSTSNVLERRFEDPTLVSEPALAKKRNLLNVYDEFVQLPQPMKKQKSSQARAMPPIINGLHEPPPHAALFPPISEEHGTGQPSTLEHIKSVTEENVKATKRAWKPRSKWSETETNHLLLGVSRHGFGKWKRILEDPEFHFNDRTAGDLKDRFRTCCPNELRASLKGQGSGAVLAINPRIKHNEPSKGAALNRILIHEEEVEASSQSAETSRRKSTRAHRKDMKDLENLGINAPIQPSDRRSRRPFTDEDDHQILKGLEKYGSAWTKIQRDPEFDLLVGRKPTDLRDRIRNAFPSVFQRFEGARSKPKMNKQSGKGNNDVMEPFVVTSIASGLGKSTAALDAQVTIPITYRDGPASPQAPEFDTSATYSMSREMDISRLLHEV